MTGALPHPGITTWLLAGGTWALMGLLSFGLSRLTRRRRHPTPPQARQVAWQATVDVTTEPYDSGIAIDSGDEQ